jgi:hypothetical protein
MTKLVHFVVILSGFLLLYGVGRTWKLKPETKYAHNLYLGEVAVLNHPSGGDVWLAVNKGDCYSLNVAMFHKDAEHLRGCLDLNTAFPAPAGAFVRVVGESVSRKHVRLIDGPLAGRSGWVEFQYLRPRQPGEFR